MLEETGYNLAGLLNPDDVIELSIKEQKISLFIVSGVPEDFPFKTKTRKEISVWNIITRIYLIAHECCIENRMVQIDRSSNLEKEQGRTWAILFNCTIHGVRAIS